MRLKFQLVSFKKFADIRFYQFNNPTFPNWRVVWAGSTTIFEVPRPLCLLECASQNGRCSFLFHKFYICTVLTLYFTSYLPLRSVRTEKYFPSVSDTSLDLRSRAASETSRKYFSVRTSRTANNLYIRRTTHALRTQDYIACSRCTHTFILQLFQDNTMNFC